MIGTVDVDDDDVGQGPRPQALFSSLRLARGIICLVCLCFFKCPSKCVAYTEMKNAKGFRLKK